jgi:hypothetical protein
MIAFASIVAWLAAAAITGPRTQPAHRRASSSRANCETMSHRPTAAARASAPAMASSTLTAGSTGRAVRAEAKRREIGVQDRAKHAVTWP